MHRYLSALAISFALISTLSPSTNAAAPAPGTFRDWNDVDEVTIIRPFQRANYKRVAVADLETRGLALPPARDNTYEAVQAVLPLTTDAFVEGLREKLAGANLQVNRGGSGGGLLLRARIVKLDPGSQAKRYLAPGAGASIVTISGEIIDAQSKQVLLRFTQERRSGWGLFGGGYRALVLRTVKQIGGDVGGLLKAF